MIQAISTIKRDKSKSFAYIDVTREGRRGDFFLLCFSFLRGNFPGKVLGRWCVWLWMRRGILRSLQIGEYSGALDGGTPELEESVASLWRYHLWWLCLCVFKCVIERYIEWEIRNRLREILWYTNKGERTKQTRDKKRLWGSAVGKMSWIRRWKTAIAVCWGPHKMKWNLMWAVLCLHDVWALRLYLGQEGSF